jgi:membrane-associated phospholipid phosphatase
MLKETLYDWFGLNQSLFLLINGVHNAFVDPLMLTGTALADYRNMPVIFALLVGLVWWGQKRARPETVQNGLRLLVLAVASYGVAVVLTAAGKYLFDFPRPLAVFSEHVVVLGQEKIVRSFPSGHAMFSMLVAALFWRNANLPGRVALALFVLWAGVSRVVVGAHFPADVLAGYAVGLASVPVARLALARSAELLRQRA